MKNLLVVWKTDNDIDIHKFVIPYVYNSKVQEWFNEVDLLIWGASQEKVKTDPKLHDFIATVIKSGVNLYACKMCADGLGTTELLENLGVNVMYTGEYLSEKLKDPNFEVITL